MEELQVVDKRMTESAPAVVGDSSPAAMMTAAISKGMDLDKLEKMLELQERWEANEAKKAFFKAVAAFKENPPEVLKDKENSQFSKGDKKAMYVSLGNLLKTVNPVLGEHGLSVSFEISQPDKMIQVSCRLNHRMGHSEIVTMEAPPDDSGGNAKNPIQKIKSTVTYLRAATFEAVTGLAATDSNLDDDGNSSGSPVEYIDEKQSAKIEKIITDKNVDKAKFLKYMTVDEVGNIPTKEYGKAIAALKMAKGRPKTKPCPNKDGGDVDEKVCETCKRRKGCPSW